MRLTLHTDYALRVMIYLSARPDRLASISEISRGYGISHNHLMKVVHNLGKLGFVTASRGRSGGIRLARPPEAISVGEVVRATEEGFTLVDCGACVIAPACGLTSLLGRATQAFLGVLDGVSFADLPRSRADLIAIFGMEFDTPNLPT